MNIGRMFASAIVRRVAYVLVALLFAALASLFGMGDAQAQVKRCEQFDTCTIAEASVYLEKVRSDREASGGNNGCTPPRVSSWTTPEAVFGPTGNSGYLQTQQKCTHPDTGNVQDSWFRSYFTQPCPAGSSWRADLGRCFDPDECLERNGASNGFPDTPRSLPYESRCVGGCDFRMNASTGQCMTILQSPDSKMCTGSFQFSGNTCAVPPDQGETHPDEEAEAGEELCTPIGSTSGLVACVKPGQPNQECIGTPKGAMVCWGTGETGSKVTGNEQQTRGPGTTEPTPTPPTPPETFDPAQKSDPVTTTTTTNTTTTTVTTVTNGTTHGTVPPGTPGFGPNPGSPDISDMEGSASGGSSCTEPVVTTGDPVMGMVARQAWETRCAVEKAAQVSVTGDIANCKSPFSVQGPEDDENVQMMKAQRAQICPGEADSDAENGNGDAFDQSSMDGPESPEASGVFNDIEVGADGLDTSGLGFSRTCPVMPQVQVFGTVIQFDNSVMCDWLELGGVFVLILAALASVRIMAGVSS